MLVRKLIFSMQIILFFDKEFKIIIINPYFYQHLFSTLLISHNNYNVKHEYFSCSALNLDGC